MDRDVSPGNADLLVKSGQNVSDEGQDNVPMTEDPHATASFHRERSTSWDNDSVGQQSFTAPTIPGSQVAGPTPASGLQGSQEVIAQGGAAAHQDAPPKVDQQQVVKEGAPRKGRSPLALKPVAELSAPYSQAERQLKLEKFKRRKQQGRAHGQGLSCPGSKRGEKPPAALPSSSSLPSNLLPTAIDTCMTKCPLPKVRAASQELLAALHEGDVPTSQFFSQRATMMLTWVEGEVGRSPAEAQPVHSFLDHGVTSIPSFQEAVAQAVEKERKHFAATFNQASKLTSPEPPSLADKLAFPDVTVGTQIDVAAHMGQGLAEIPMLARRTQSGSFLGQTQKGVAERAQTYPGCSSPFADIIEWSQAITAKLESPTPSVSPCVSRSEAQPAGLLSTDAGLSRTSAGSASIRCPQNLLAEPQGQHARAASLSGQALTDLPYPALVNEMVAEPMLSARVRFQPPAVQMAGAVMPFTESALRLDSFVRDVSTLTGPSAVTRDAGCPLPALDAAEAMPPDLLLAQAGSSLMYSADPFQSERAWFPEDLQPVGAWGQQEMEVEFAQEQVESTSAAQQLKGGGRIEGFQPFSNIFMGDSSSQQLLRYLRGDPRGGESSAGLRPPAEEVQSWTDIQSAGDSWRLEDVVAGSLGGGKANEKSFLSVWPEAEFDVAIGPQGWGPMEALRTFKDNEIRRGICGPNFGEISSKAVLDRGAFDQAIDLDLVVEI